MAPLVFFGLDRGLGIGRCDLSSSFNEALSITGGGALGIIRCTTVGTGGIGGGALDALRCITTGRADITGRGLLASHSSGVSVSLFDLKGVEEEEAVMDVGTF